jgi:hypothetical protein
VTVATIYPRKANQEHHATREVLSTTRQIEDRWQGECSPAGIDVRRARFVAPPGGACSNGRPIIVLLRERGRGDGRL